MSNHSRHFLFLQGPHGPFFSALARSLKEAGHDTSRIAFNAGDAVFWRGPSKPIPYRYGLDEWEEWLGRYFAENCVTDLVCYGASRPIHRIARAPAKRSGVRLHVFEEGYLRPYWVTYEREGTNASSPIMDLSVEDMATALALSPAQLRPAPDRWGDMRSHIFWGATYHAALLAGARRFPAFTPHRSPAPKGELAIYSKHLLTLPLRRIKRRIATSRLLRSPWPYHVVLLQLAHDANFRDNGPFPSQRAFLEAVFRGFAQGAPAHHRLVLKAHPFEDGREPLGPIMRELSETYDLRDRVSLVTGGKLARLLDHAQSAVTVNSTSAEQALWRGLPTKAFGRATYRRPHITSEQPLPAFFASPQSPSSDAYETYRRFLLATSQIEGGYYSATGRRTLLRRLPDLMLAEMSAQDRLLTSAATVQHLAAVRA